MHNDSVPLRAKQLRILLPSRIDAALRDAMTRTRRGDRDQHHRARSRLATSLSAAHHAPRVAAFALVALRMFDLAEGCNR